MPRVFACCNLVFALSLLSACASSGSYTPLLGAEPEIGGELSRAPRTLRLYYDALPMVERSSLKLTGPNGEQLLMVLDTGIQRREVKCDQAIARTRCGRHGF